jgi:CHAD domain-containing protein
MATAQRTGDEIRSPEQPEPESTRPRRRGADRWRAERPGSAGAVLLDYLATQVDRIDREDQRIRHSEPDSVHQLRVAARRLRSALQAFRPLLERERTEPVVDALRELGRALAPARDAEVLRKGITAELDALDPELRLGPVQALVTRHFARQEAETGAGVLTTLDGERYARLRADLDDLLDRPPLRRRARGPASKVLPPLVGRSARRLRKAVDAARDAPAEDRDVTLHTARKVGKRLRYATEVARPAVGKPAKRFAKALKPFHKALGEHQDAVVARGELRRLGAQAHADGNNGFSLGLLHAQGDARAARVERELDELWRRAWTGKSRRWMK